jgi:hypothetical protein
MPTPDSTMEEVRASVLRYLRMYEEGQLTLGDLAAEMAVMAPAYDHVMGGIADSYGALLEIAYRFHTHAASDPRTSSAELESAMTEFRRSEARWD